ncbi:MAG: tetratricopeptide repeat-containing sulfotransferase family protein [Sphingomicrobium sp.]
MHHQSGRIDEAEAIYLRLLKTVPNQPNALHLLGLIETHRGNPARGVELISEALPALEKAAQVHFDLGGALRMCGRRDDAIERFREALALKADYVEAHVALGSALGEMGNFEAAVSHCRTAIAIDPTSLTARLTLAAALQGAKRMPEAAQAWREIISLRPDRAESYSQLAVQLVELGLLNEALYCHDRALALQPDNPLFHCGKGSALLRLYYGERAEASFRQAIQLAPESKEGWAGLSWALRLLGRFDEADECLQRLREIDPTDIRAVRHVPATGGQRHGPEEINELVAVCDNPESKPIDRITAGFAVGRLLHDCGRYDEAFARYSAANLLVRENWPAKADRFDIDVFSKSTDALIESNTPESLAEAAITGNISELPVFIVGMPRSGTTLVEQICASHSRVLGAGERNDIAALAVELHRQRNDGSDLQEAARRAADAHIVRLHRLARGALRVVDKLPDNMILIGLITRLFPRARIIYCSRDPRDISLSCFFQLFVEGAQHFSYDLTECAKRCRNVERMARHWMKLLPHHMIEVNYESLVGDLEGQSRRLIDFLGLEWEPACLDFHQTERTVATVSHWQVRQPIYSSSVGRWREYEKHLGGVFAALEDPATSDTAEAATAGLSA